MDDEIMQIDIDEIFGNSGVEIHEMHTNKVIASYKESRNSDSSNKNNKSNNGHKTTKVVINKERGNNYA